MATARWLRGWWPWLAVCGASAAGTGVLWCLGHAGAARTTLVVLGTVLAASGAVAAVRDTVRDRASLQPVTWGVWAVLTAAAAVASASSADYPAATFAAVGTISCTTVAVVAARYGPWKLTVLDLGCAVLAVAGIAVWLSVRQPGPAVAAACAGDFLGLIPTVRHAWVCPREVPTSVFTLITAGGVCTVGAAWGICTVTAVAYPLYVAASSGAVAALTRRPARTPIPPAATAVGDPLVPAPGRRA